MTFKTGLLHARHHIVFMLGLATAFLIAIHLERLHLAENAAVAPPIAASVDIPITRPGELSAREIEWAKIAWVYFQNNYQEATGLVNSVDRYPATTMWDTASYLLGLISAHRLGIVDRSEFDRRIEKVLAAFATMPLFDGSLPNKSYNTLNLAMVDYNNNPTERGIGWSAIDIGRVLVPLNIIVWNYPEHSAAVKSVLKRWDFGKLVKDGLMQGAAVDGEGRTEYVQEGRLGYEEYAAKSLTLMGYDVFKALEYADFLEYVDIYGIQVPTDRRDPESYHAHNYVVSEPYILDGLEFGWDNRTREFAYRVYSAQVQRYRNEGILTAVSEDNIDEAPYFVYNTVFTSGKPWNTITDKGEDASSFKSLSTKAAMGWHFLYGTDYTEKLIERVQDLHDPARGWYSGWYEVKQRPNRAITANTNGIILEALCYRRFGKLVGIYPDSTRGTFPAKDSPHESDSISVTPVGQLPANRLSDPSDRDERGNLGAKTGHDSAKRGAAQSASGIAKKPAGKSAKEVGRPGKGAKGKN